ncbi:uncharacterized protein Z520_06589 [Fonsecaea multimorphosa CBS 102226]|uniref:Uncharacterized protein n=1 Tax=Fonsecaea multimorphosa CBS 102226 TaxID=1442371 RepID=A0A0D2ILA7_9EURO|nr:uncharacterized protein Z520_06589 [Fonsecaea multimorphosa CBS 102226]KIX97811.1 hypothetical protein Z520_06589 [Fonsecaea multimorphosa CBS 102226]OAL23581.1 hypothetical protein AYO22_06158 [Fonsecaea multimorphosa]
MSSKRGHASRSRSNSSEAQRVDSRLEGRKSRAVDKIRQNWHCSPDDITTQPPDNWSRDTLAKLAQLSSLCSRENAQGLLERMREKRIQDAPKSAPTLSTIDVTNALADIDRASVSTPEEDAALSDHCQPQTASGAPVAVTGDPSPIQESEARPVVPDAQTSLTVEDAGDIPQLPGFCRNAAFLMERCLELSGSQHEAHVRESFDEILNHIGNPREGGCGPVQGLVEYLLGANLHPDGLEELTSYLNSNPDFTTDLLTERLKWRRLRAVRHSFVQQLLRQDPLVYLLMVALQPDMKWGLINNPVPISLRLRRATDEPPPLGLFFKLTDSRPMLAIQLSCPLPDTSGELFLDIFYDVVYSSLEKDICSKPEVLEDLRRSNATCVVPQFFLDGRPRDLDGLPTQSTAVSIPPCSSIGAAVNGIEDWHSPPVQEEMAILLGSDVMAAKEYLDGVRERILSSYKVAFEDFVEMDIRVNGESSVFWEGDNMEAGHH